MTSPGVIALFGPTGVGKTEIAVALARRLRTDGEDPVAVSADALQVYRGLEVLTGAADATSRAGLEHRLVSFVAITETFSVGRYARLAHAEIDGLLAAGRRPIVVGGTGLYLRAALTDLSLRPPPAAGVRERWQAELAARGSAALHAELERRAPGLAATIAPTDRHRIVRALELSEDGSATGEVAGAAQAALAAPPGGAESQLWTASTRHPTRLFGLVMDRAALDARIDARAAAMARDGAAEEVARAIAAGASPTARRALGFDELAVGDVDGMRRRTRRFARRQLTWMRKLGGVETIDVTDRGAEEVAGEIEIRLRPPSASGRVGG